MNNFTNLINTLLKMRMYTKSHQIESGFAAAATHLRTLGHQGDNEAQAIMAELDKVLGTRTKSAEQIESAKMSCEVSSTDVISEDDPIDSIASDLLERGLALEEGVGEAQRFDEAAANYVKASLLGSMKGLKLLANLLTRGLGLPQDRRAALLLQGIAQRDYLGNREVWAAFALQWTGLHTLVPSGVSSDSDDHQVVRSWLSERASEGCAISAHNLGLELLALSKNELDVEKASQWLKTAARLGCAASLRILAEISEALGVDAEIDSLDLYKEAASAGDGPSLIHLGLWSYVRPQERTHDWHNYLSAAHERRVPMAKLWLARCLLFASGGVSDSTHDRRRASELGLEFASFELLNKHDVNPVDPRVQFVDDVLLHARGWIEIPLERASSLGNRAATVELAQLLCYRRGAQDLPKARDLYLQEVRAIKAAGWAKENWLCAGLCELGQFVTEAGAIMLIPDAGSVNLKLASQLLKSASKIGGRAILNDLKDEDVVSAVTAKSKWLLGQLLSFIYASDEAHGYLMAACREEPQVYVSQYLRLFKDGTGIFANHSRYVDVRDEFRNVADAAVQCAIGLSFTTEHGLEHLKKASALGSAEAACRLGQIYAAGEGVQKDMQTGLTYLRFGAARGDSLARHLAEFIDAMSKLPADLSIDDWCRVEALANEGHSACAYETGHGWLRQRRETTDPQRRIDLGIAAARVLQSAALAGHDLAWQALCEEVWAIWSDEVAARSLEKVDPLVILGGAFCGDVIPDLETVERLGRLCVEFMKSA